MIHNPVLRAVLRSRNSYKKSYTIQTRKASFRGSSLQVEIRWTGLLYGASVLNIKTEQASFLIGLTAVTRVTEEEFAYLKTAVPSVDQFYYHKYEGWGISHGNYFISWIYVNGSQTYMCRVECLQA